LKIVKDTIAGLGVRLEKLRFGFIHKKVGPFKYGMLIAEFGIEKFNKVGILVTEVTEENH
jgi:hypothetical protein